MNKYEDHVKSVIYSLPLAPSSLRNVQTNSENMRTSKKHENRVTNIIYALPLAPFSLANYENIMNKIRIIRRL